jgi:hypothetical protein
VAWGESSRADRRIRSQGLLAFQFALFTAPLPMLAMFWLMLLNSMWWVVAFASLVAVLGVCGILGASYASTLSEAAIVLRGPRLHHRVDTTRITAVLVRRPYGRRAGYDVDSVGCAIAVRLVDGSEWLLPGGLHWQRRTLLPSVVDWADEHGITVDDQPLRTAPRFTQSVRAWYSQRD